MQIHWVFPLRKQETEAEIGAGSDPYIERAQPLYVIAVAYRKRSSTAKAFEGKE